MSNFYSNNSLISENAPVEYYWDANGDVAGTGGSGTFNATSLIFRKSSDIGPLVPYPNSQKNFKTIIFSGVNGGVSLPGLFNVDRIKILTNNYSFGVTTTPAGFVFQNNGEIYSESSVGSCILDIWGSCNTFKKTGSGSVTFNNPTNQNPPMFLSSCQNILIEQGTLNITGNTVNNFTTPINISSGAILGLSNNVITGVYAGSFSGSGTIRRNSSTTGTTIITGNNSSFTGSWLFAQGSNYVAFQNDNSVGSPNVGITCNGPSAGFYFNTSGNTLASTRTITLNSNCNLFINGISGNTNTIASLITGTGSITKQSGETHILTNSNNYTGSTFLRSSSNGSGVPDSILRLLSGSTLGGTSGSSNDSGNIVFQEPFSNSILEFTTAANLGVCSQIRFRNTGGTVGWGGCLRYIGSTNETVNKTIQCDTNIGIRLESSGSGQLTISGSFSQTNRNLYLGGTGNGILFSAFSGTGSVTKRGSGTWIFPAIGASQTYTGSTDIQAGTLSVGKLTSNPGSKINSAYFTNTTLTVEFLMSPVAGEVYRILPGPTTQTYSSVILTSMLGANVSGRTATYNSTNSTLTIA